MSASAVAAQDAGQRRRLPVHRGHLDPHLPERGRDLGSDEAEPDHDRAPPGSGRGADTIALLHGAQLVDPGQVRPGCLNRAVASAGGDEEPIVRNVAAAL
jgi:hypothetical protein